VKENEERVNLCVYVCVCARARVRVREREREREREGGREREREREREEKDSRGECPREQKNTDNSRARCYARPRAQCRF